MAPEIVASKEYWVIENYLGSGYLEDNFVPEVSENPRSDYFSETRNLDMAEHFENEIVARTFVDEWKRQLTGLGRLIYPVKITEVAIKSQSTDEELVIKINREK